MAPTDSIVTEINDKKLIDDNIYNQKW